MKKSESNATLAMILLALFFVVLKLTKIITWSWFWILIPIWFGPVLILGCAMLVAIWRAEEWF